MVDRLAERKFILEFICLYHELPALWDVNNKDYTKRDKKWEQYAVLIEKYRQKYPNANKNDVVKKINSLRTNFRKELKRLQDAQNNGENVEPSLWYFQEMKFLQCQEPQRAYKRPDKVEVSGSSSVGSVNMENEDSCASSTDQDAAPITLGSLKRKNEIEDSTEQLMKMVCQSLVQPTDDCDKIVAAWAVELRKMDPEQQLFAKKAINEVIFEGQMGTLHRHSVEINALPSICKFNSSQK